MIITNCFRHLLTGAFFPLYLLFFISSLFIYLLIFPTFYSIPYLYQNYQIFKLLDRMFQIYLVLHGTEIFILQRTRFKARTEEDVLVFVSTAIERELFLK